MVYAKKAFIYSTLLLVIFFVIAYKSGGEYLLMTGDLSEEHKILSKNCRKCHTPFKNDFSACNSCHQDFQEISLHSETVKCVFCHMSHNFKLKEIAPMTCLSKGCHEKMMKVPDHSGDPRICLDCHPEHLFEKRAVSRKVSDLIFSHKLHTDKSKPKAFYPCSSCHQISSKRIRVDSPDALVQCHICHSEWVGGHNVKKSIKDEKCARCHYSKKRKIKIFEKKNRLQHARFNHSKHINLECTVCHFTMEAFNELEDVFIFTQKYKDNLCSQCHLNPFTLNRSGG